VQCVRLALFSSQLLQVSTVLGAALEEQRKEGEWIEGIAIWVAVAIVIMVGECCYHCEWVASTCHRMQLGGLTGDVSVDHVVLADSFAPVQLKPFTRRHVASFNVSNCCRRNPCCSMLFQQHKELPLASCWSLPHVAA
jgi:hypothetical protein